MEQGTEGPMENQKCFAFFVRIRRKTYRKHILSEKKNVFFAVKKQYIEDKRSSL